MTREEAKKFAEDKVYIYWTRGILEDFAKSHGFTKNVERAKRETLEDFAILKLIEKYTDDYE